MLPYTFLGSIDELCSLPSGKAYFFLLMSMQPAEPWNVKIMQDSSATKRNLDLS